MIKHIAWSVLSSFFHRPSLFHSLSPFTSSLCLGQLFLRVTPCAAYQVLPSRVPHSMGRQLIKYPVTPAPSRPPQCQPQLAELFPFTLVMLPEQFITHRDKWPTFTNQATFHRHLEFWLLCISVKVRGPRCVPLRWDMCPKDGIQWNVVPKGTGDVRDGGMPRRGLTPQPWGTGEGCWRRWHLD